jgi:hypothetical protein
MHLRTHWHPDPFISTPKPKRGIPTYEVPITSGRSTLSAKLAAYGESRARGAVEEGKTTGMGKDNTDVVEDILLLGSSSEGRNVSASLVVFTYDWCRETLEAGES